nr:hypothetical protein [Tanacetum cinerariifolium]
MQKKKNDVKARTTLLLSLPDEHQLRFSKYKTVRSKHLVVMRLPRRQRRIFSSSSMETLEQKAQKLWSRCSADCKSDLDTISLDDLYNHLKIDEDDMEEMDIKWNMALLSMGADKFWKRTGKKISIQGSDVAGFDKSKVEYFNCHKMGHFARECRAPRSQDRGRRDNFRQGSKAKEHAPKALMAIDGVGWD